MESVMEYRIVNDWYMAEEQEQLPIGDPPLDPEEDDKEDDDEDAFDDDDDSSDDDDDDDDDDDVVKELPTEEPPL